MTTHSWSTFAYTPEGWLATRQDAMQNTVNTTGYTYDSLGRPTGISYPSGVAVGYAYDHGKLAAVTSTRGGTTTTIASDFRYQPFGTATEWTYGNGLKHSASFDQDGRLTHLGTSEASSLIRAIRKKSFPTKELCMKKSKFSEAIVRILKEVEAGAKVAETCRKHDISEPTQRPVCKQSYQS